MNLARALFFHKDNYDIKKKSDDNLSWGSKILMIALCKVLILFKLTTVLNFIISLFFKKNRIIESEILSFIFSRNHKIVYNELAKFNMEYPIVNLSFSEELISNKNNLFIPKWIMLFASLANSKLFLQSIKENKDDEIYNKNTLKFFKLSGYHLLYGYLLKKVKVVIKYNDHIFNNVLLHDMCKERNIKTVYIQHAPVSYRFPPLHHDLNVLFSKDSQSKYKFLNNTVKAFNFFDVRFLMSKNIIQQSSNNKKSILFALNIKDDINYIKQVVDLFASDYTIILRPHPREKRQFENLIDSKNVSISNGNSVWEDLAKTSIVILNESSVVLEAIYSGKKVYKAAFLSKAIDNYSFIKKGLITKEFNNINDLKKAVFNNETYFDKSKLNYFIGDFDNINQLTLELKQEIERLLN